MSNGRKSTTNGTSPPAACALLFGNVWFAWLATRLATKENRPFDVTAQPYGMNTTVIYITIYAISLPAIQAGFSKYNPGTESRRMRTPHVPLARRRPSSAGR